MSPFLPVMGANSTTNVNSTTTNAITPGVALWNNSQSMPTDFVTQVNFTIEQPFKGNSALRVTYLWILSLGLFYAASLSPDRSHRRGFPGRLG